MRRALAVILLLALGAAGGASFAYEALPVREPRACMLVREASAGYLIEQSNLLSAVQARGAASGDLSAWRQHDAKVSRILKKMEPIAKDYNELYDECEATS